MYIVNLYDPIVGRHSYHEVKISKGMGSLSYLDVNYVQSVQATHDDYQIIVSEIENIPKLNFELHSMKSNCVKDFTWFGDIAKSIHCYLISNK
jgi:hypothetical protein